MQRTVDGTFGSGIRSKIFVAAGALLLLGAGTAGAQFGAVVGPDASAGAAVCEFTAPAGSTLTHVYCWVARHDGRGEAVRVVGDNWGVGTAAAVTAWVDDPGLLPIGHYGCVFGEYDAADGLRHGWGGCNPLAP